MENKYFDFLKITLFILLALSIAIFPFWAYPQWNVWKSELAGQAELVKAEQTKKIMIEVARAEKESATLRADAIVIMGQAAKDFPEYRQQEFIQAFGEALREGNISQIIYVPTESNIPITESRIRR